MIPREPGAGMHLGMLIGTTNTHLSLLPVMRDLVLFGRKETASQVSGFSPTAKIGENGISFGPVTHSLLPDFSNLSRLLVLIRQDSSCLSLLLSFLFLLFSHVCLCGVCACVACICVGVSACVWTHVYICVCMRAGS